VLQSSRAYPRFNHLAKILKKRHHFSSRLLSLWNCDPKIAGHCGLG
jgi:hypothetical protein